MVLIIGGSYQGKLAYALDRFGLTDEDVYRCSDDPGLPQGKKVIYEIDKWVLALTKAGADTEEAAQWFMENNAEAVVICNDISCGIVPEDAVLRKWREAVGRALAELSRHSDEVVRLFCGIPTRIK